MGADPISIVSLNERLIGKAQPRAALIGRIERTKINPRVPWRRRSGQLEADQSASDRDQTASDTDQTASDTDQSMSDRDQAASDADQRVSDRDQVLADRELGANSAADSTQLRAHELAKAGRGEGTMARMATTAVRAQVAAERHEQAWRRDEMARHRDEVAAARDREAEEVDRAAEEMAGQLGKDSPAAKVAAVARASAAAARTRAAEDRHRAARDREEAARDRQEAASDRELLMAEIERSQMDESTGAYGRQVGEMLLRHELERAQGMGRTLALCVVAFEKTTQTEQHQDDSALTALARDLFLAMWGRLRPFDPIVRWSEKEFVCALAEVNPDEARRWLSDACFEIAERHPEDATCVGVASSLDGNDDTLEGLVEQASEQTTS
jgi:GGDEF domain-containing protein